MARLPEIIPVTVDAVFDDFKGRRVGLIKALTIEVEKFYQACDPEKENMYLYALPDGSWEVCVPVEEVPTELPEPALGINFARDGMQTNDWLSLVAVHSDTWLMAVAFYLCGFSNFRRDERRELFERINDLPTVYEVWNSFVNRPRDPPARDNNNTGTDPNPKVRALYSLAPKVLNFTVPEEQDTGDVGHPPPPTKVVKLAVPKKQDTGDAGHPLPTKVVTLVPKEQYIEDAKQGGAPCCGLKKFVVKMFN